MKQKKINIKKEVDKKTSKWLELNLDKIKKVYQNTTKFENFIFKEIPYSSDDWFKEFKKEMKSIKDSNKKLQLIYDLYLSSIGLNVEYPEGEAPVEFKPKKQLKF